MNNVPGTTRYQQQVDLLIHHASEDYRYLTRDLQSFQTGHLRAYLWLSTVLIAFNVSLYLRLLDTNNPIPILTGTPSVCFYVSAAVALLILLVVFLLGIDTMRGRSKVVPPFGNYDDRRKAFWKEKEGDNEATLSQVLVTFQKAIDTQKAECNRRAEKLQRMSYLLLTSAGFTILSVLFFFNAG